MSKRIVLLVILILILSFSCSAERGDWKKAKSQHSIEAYEEYLAKYPEGQHAVQAREKITELYYEQAESANTIEAYQDFLAKYPEGKYVIRARAKLRITELYYEQAESANTIEAYEEFLKLYPSGTLSLAAKRNLEQLFYEQVQSENLLSSYEDYVKRYPEGQFAGEAWAIIRKKIRDPIDATVVDDQGNSFLVKGLKAYYEAYGMWHPETPTSLTADFYVVCYNMKGRVRVEEKKVWVPFYNIRRIDFKEEEDPRYKHIYEQNIYIQKRDGSSISILLFGNPYVVREKDSDGKTTKEIRSDSIFFSSGNIQGEEILLRGFKGLLEEPSGGEREYYIRHSDVRSIAFKEL